MWEDNEKAPFYVSIFLAAPISPIRSFTNIQRPAADSEREEELRAFRSFLPSVQKV